MSDHGHASVRNVDQLRNAIDTGRTQDKIDHPDPAAAPLGTDAEAAGTPQTQSEVDIAAGHELQAGPPRNPQVTLRQAATVVVGVLVLGCAVALILRARA